MMTDYRINVYKHTNDSWYPSYQLCSDNENQQNMLVEVSFMKLADDQITDDDKQWRVCVWGEDDCGMEKDYIPYNDAWDEFITILQMDALDMENLRELDFYSA